ncbi:type II toxin-antitoxin system HicA family toxin [bacterium]|nr:type II toxin-antitoxin system HicA family toxin [bacterium]
MSPAIPAITGKQASGAAERAGFRLDRQKGSHKVYLRDSDKRRVVIPDHAGKILKRKTLTGIIQDMGLTVDDFIALL